MTRDEWIAAFAAELGAKAPGPDQVEAILALAGIAAHASERTAAPVACWVGAHAGAPVERCLEIAKRIPPESD